MWTKIKQWSVKKIFRRRFKYFDYPFEKADDHIKSLKPVARMRYYKNVSEWFNSDAYKTEMQEMIKTFYEELSTKTHKEPEFTGYRLALLLLQRMEQRLNHLCAQYELEEKIQTHQENTD